MSKLLQKRRGGFTLIELMIVVAIIGILAAIAIPNFMRFQLKAKAGEGKTNLAAIRTAEESYMAEFGKYIPTSAAHPASVPGTQKEAWGSAAPVGFGTIGWAPEGAVYYQYMVNTDSSAGVDFLAEAVSDIDGNASTNEWAYVKPVPGATSAGAAATISSCSSGGVYDPNSGGTDLLETVGPCDSTSGNSKF
jgi:type IV pilus assembly protein PilA